MYKDILGASIFFKDMFVKCVAFCLNFWNVQLSSLLTLYSDFCPHLCYCYHDRNVVIQRSSVVICRGNLQRYLEIYMHLWRFCERSLDVAHGRMYRSSSQTRTQYSVIIDLVLYITSR